MENEIDVDGLLEGIESPSTTVPMTNPAPVEPPQAKTEAQEFDITWNGKQIKAPIDRLKQWASQGYDYAQRMEAFKAEQAKHQQEVEQYRQQVDSKLQRYQEVDQFAAKNPEWWSHVEETYKQRQQAFDPENPLVNELNSVKSQLADIVKFKEELSAKQAMEKQKKEDETLNGEISEMRNLYKDLDWAGLDESGQTLEARVLQHAVNNGINSFRAAFRDYNHDQLVKIAEMKARESATQERQKAAKLGLLGKTPTPTKGIQATDVRGKTYNQLVQEAITELGLR